MKRLGTGHCLNIFQEKNIVKVIDENHSFIVHLHLLCYFANRVCTVLHVCPYVVKI